MDTVSHHNQKIDEALKLLNQAAKEKKEDFQKMVAEKYSHIREALSDAAAHQAETMHEWKERADGMIREGKAKAAKTAKDIDHEVHKNPWMFIGGAAVVGLVAGLIIAGRRPARS